MQHINTNPTKVASPSTPLLRSSPSATSYSAMASSARPNISRAQTTINASTDTAPATPILSRPMPTRAASANDTVRQTNNNGSKTTATRPSLLKRISSHLDATLELSNRASRAPKCPSHWTDHAHRATLLKTWDSTRDAAAKSKARPSTRVQLVDVEKAMLKQFPELGAGDHVLDGEWMEYVLGVALRPPFCAQGNMGRWEVLSGPAKMGGMGAWGA